MRGPAWSGSSVDLAVIVPCFNVEDTLALQLDALVGEEWSRPWGIVVVDNRSTDDTVTVARRYLERGVKVVSAHDGRGVAYVRNAGVRAVDATAVAFCDGDDVVCPGWVSAIGDALDRADLVGGQNETEALNSQELSDSRPNGRPGRLPTFGTLEFVPGGNGGMRRELFEQLGGYDDGFIGLEDIEFSLRAHAAGAVLQNAAGAVLSYRYREGFEAVWKQGYFYGRGRPALILRARELGLPSPGRLEGLRSWAWLFVHLSLLRSRGGRYKLLWVLANRIGVLRGAIACRSPFL
jgi:glycosyltransferase involved in cell wall biosynthesis